MSFDILLVEVQDFENFTDQFRGIYGIYLTLVKKNQKITTCNQLDLEKSPQTLNLLHGLTTRNKTNPKQILFNFSVKRKRKSQSVLMLLYTCVFQTLSLLEMANYLVNMKYNLPSLYYDTSTIQCISRLPEILVLIYLHNTIAMSVI